MPPNTVGSAGKRRSTSSKGKPGVGGGITGAKSLVRRAQPSFVTNLSSYDRSDPFHAFNVLLKLFGSLASRAGSCQYKVTPEEHRLSLHLLTIIEPFIGSSTPTQRTLITRQPTEILDAIVFHVDSPRDLLNLGVTCHRMHGIVFPRHMEYRVIRCKASSLALWNHLIVNRSLARNVRRLEVMDERALEREIVPAGITTTDTDLESTDDELGMHLKQERFLVAALNRMTHLAQFVWSSNHSPISLDGILPSLLTKPTLKEIEINDNVMFSPLGDDEETDESQSSDEQKGKVLPALRAVSLRSTRHTYGLSKHPSLARAKGLLNSCPKLEALEINYTPPRSHPAPVPAQDLLLTGRWPQLRSLSLTNLRCTPLTGFDATSTFILAHLNLEILHLDIVPRNPRDLVFPANALPKLKEVKACKEIVGALLECPCDGDAKRPLEVIKGVSLARNGGINFYHNTDFLEKLKRFGSDTVKRIELVGWTEIDDLKRLVESAPRVVWLDIGKRITSNAQAASLNNVNEWAMLLSSLPELATFHGIKFFYESHGGTSAGDKSRVRKNDESASVLVWRCPKLRRVDHWDDSAVLHRAAVPMISLSTILVVLIIFTSLAGAIVPWFLLHLYLTSTRSTNATKRERVLKSLGTSPNGKRLVGFFHPYCNAGGGGERVLWTAIAAIQRNEKDMVSVVYSGDIDANKEEIIAKVKSRFDINLDPTKIIFVFLNSRRYVEDSTWPYFTLLGQSLGSMYLAWEAMNKLIPDLYIDTMGYAFTFHIVTWVANIPIGAYVHYPTISTDMLERVKSRKRWHTNSSAISSSSILSTAKLWYYRLFMYYYSLSLRSAIFVMANSTWTKNHVDSILQHSDPLLDFLHLTSPPLFILRFLANQNKNPVTKAQIVYPPCDTREMAKFPLEGRERVIVSVAQFRPEKDHPAQLRALYELFRQHEEFKESLPVKLVMIGGSRNAKDAARVEDLRRLSKELGLDKHVEILVNAPYPDMLRWLSKASIGMNTMVDEHFGINVVEYMAAGVIPVAHASAGPLYDIIVPFNGQPTGFHAKTPEEFADALYKALSLSKEEDLALRQRARTWAVQRFSEEEFEKGWNASGWSNWL
ncbi:hypothetical protein VNI00_001107 [Paramarasmius palmivorus]|uniref:GDP-Man:Man(3)GlcNAc(2)-PP-Dol alpha-1,2-mannosyltransferase n=1 Tax=Paramarasmius palmivorus TaxID=297713 RepID=A0AAW0E6L0_9AGAR